MATLARANEKKVIFIAILRIEMTINEIIAESIESYLNESLVFEDKDDNGGKGKAKTFGRKKKKFRKRAIKKKGGLRGDFDVESDELYNAGVDDQEQSEVSSILDSPMINLKAVATKLYPDHTEEGAQSQLRKKIKHEVSDSGKVYRLKKGEVRKLRAIISKMLGR